MRHFYDANVTILHTKFYRELVQPGQVVLGADSHTSSHGGLGAFAVGLGGADVTAAMVLGESWLEVPEAIAVDYEGTLPFGISGKDVILKTLGELGRNTVAMERSVEYRGDAVRTLLHGHALHHRQHDGRVRRLQRHLRGGRGGGAVALAATLGEGRSALLPRRRGRALPGALPHRPGSAGPSAGQALLAQTMSCRWSRQRE